LDLCILKELRLNFSDLRILKELSEISQRVEVEKLGGMAVQQENPMREALRVWALL
jgi:hypothetical protein